MKAAAVTLLSRCLALPPPFSKCDSPECSRWSGTRGASPLHTGPRPPDNEASCFQAV